MIGKRFGFFLFISLIVAMSIGWGMQFSVTSAYGGENKKDLPPRAISISPEYTGVVVTKGKDVSMDLTVTNGGRQDEDIKLTLTTVPTGWKAWIETYRYEVTGVHVASDESKSLTLKAEPDKSVGPGKYAFSIKAQTHDGELTSLGELVIAVKEKEKEKKARGLSIVTSYPELQGPTDATFEFSLEVENESDKDTILNISSLGPENWDINFKPAYEQKFISSLRLKANQSQTMAVEVKPYPLAEPGKYPITVKVNSEYAKGEAELSVVLTGTHKLEMATLNELLSLSALQGEEANLSLYVKNSGSATQHNVRFLSFKPENWKVDFAPERFEAFAPGALKQVEVIITPAGQTLVGDYSVNLAVEGEKASENMELRVTVRASSAWGWIGVGIIVFVIAGLVSLFIRMGRR